MDNITIAYILEVVAILINLFLPLSIALVVGIIVLVVVWVLLFKDAKSRGLSGGHGAWSLLGIIGVLVYHLAFARKS